MKPLVSILIPAFNAGRWVRQTLTCAVGQTWPRKEIILVDDGSTDDTLSIALTFASSGVLVVSRDHCGAAAARNHALKLCQGEYIQWLDADDLLEPDKIERQMNALDRCALKKPLLSSSWGKFYYRKANAQFCPTSIWRDVSPLECMVRKMDEGAFMQTTAWLVSRELTDAAGPWDTRLLGDDDGEYFCRVMLKSDGVVFVPEAKAYWRISGSNTLSRLNLSKEKLEAHFLAMRLQIQWVRAVDDSPKVRAACLTWLECYLPFFYPEYPHIVRQLDNLAGELGGKLRRPQLSWKYAWIQKCFGWNLAKQAKVSLPNLKESVKIQWDRSMYHFERGRIVQHRTGM